MDGGERLTRLFERLVGQNSPLTAILPNDAAAALAGDGTGIGYSQFNELLLLLGFDRVTRGFFQFLIDGTTEYAPGASIAALDELEIGIDRFRQLGLLRFGNIKYAFKTLSRDVEVLDEELSRLTAIDEVLFASRHDPIRPIRAIAADKTYYLGYVIESELRARLAADSADAAALEEDRQRLAVVDIGRANQEAYLASDHLDVYVATSMRQRHEFLAVSRLATEIFSRPELVNLKLRWFDPTQAYCLDRIDKGISEALMLRRAKCTIYFAQETDTLGKDSELASTLAQGKPVIAFVPEVDAGFAARLLKELQNAYPSRRESELILEQLQLFSPKAAWVDPQVRGWIDDRSAAWVPEALERLQTAIRTHYDGRARTLKESHPLGVQVNLETGVANGVLVVRTVRACAELVRRIVTRTLEFTLNEEKGSTVLRENISGCVFRVATGDVMLTNAF